jgi:hypothetical protein
MFEKAFDEISLGDLQALVKAGVPEGRCLEFKTKSLWAHEELDAPMPPER